LALSGLGGIWLTRQAMQPIEKSFQRLQQFTADASHELRNPLMAIKSNAAVALKYAEGMRELDAEKFRAIASATTQMTALTEDLLLLARTDKAPLQKHDRVNLTTLLEDLIQLHRAEADIKQIHLKEQIQEHLEVFGDAVQLTRLFTNLLSNALRYTLEQGLIELQTHQEGNQILVSVKDTGIGITPEQLEHIFDRFWQADRARSYGSGFGLGLAIAQNIAHNHGGTISVTSQPGTGSCFRVQLPIADSAKH
jgi:signal transduction histidine kinase